MGGGLREQIDEAIDEEVFEHVLGQPDGLRFGLSFSGTSEEDRSCAWGRGALWLKGQLLWYSQDSDGPRRPVEWSWIDLLEFLGKFWLRISLEQHYPFGLTPPDPTELRRAAERRWEGLSNRTRRLEEDEVIARFEVRHDLARALRGVYLPSVLLMREGENMWICAEERRVQRPARAVLRSLEEVGDLIANQLRGSDAARARSAVHRWAERSQADIERRLEVQLGLSHIEIASLQGDNDASTFWELTDSFADSELSAAARMTGGALDLDAQAKILRLIREVPSHPTPLLDELSSEADSMWERDGVPAEAYKEGHQLALWLRTKPDIVDAEGRVDPRALLTRWGVLVKDVTLSEEVLEALAFWGPRHGPAVLLNQQGTRADTPHGARSTLAHEICHLLVDRGGSLPMAEVFGGRVPGRPERRANAFAAEFLLPRAAAAEGVRRSADVKAAVKTLSDTYGVNWQLVAWQIANGEEEVYSHLSPPDRAFIDRLTDRFYR